MIRFLLIVVFMLAACGSARPVDYNTDTAVETSQDTTQPTDCAAPQVVTVQGEKAIDAKTVGETKARFLAAFGRACASGLLESKEFFDPKAVDQGRLFLLNAPEANVASIYLSEPTAHRMVLEYRFKDSDGKTNVPSAAELDEAIYCAMSGATGKEQEESGRCLPD